MMEARSVKKWNSIPTAGLSLRHGWAWGAQSKTAPSWGAGVTMQALPDRVARAQEEVAKARSDLAPL